MEIKYSGQPCRTCAFWVGERTVRSEKINPKGECRRHKTATWADGSCGDWVPDHQTKRALRKAALETATE